MINSAMEERRHKIDEKMDQIIELRPEFADALNNCINFSCKYNFLCELEN
jgi:hypothetical protein